MTIDTHGYVKALEAAGIDRKTAEAHLQAMTAHVLPQLASKDDLKDTEQALRAEIMSVRADMWKIALAVILGTASLTAFLQKLLG